MKKFTVAAIVVVFVAGASAATYWFVLRDRSEPMRFLPAVEPVDMGAVYVEKNLFRIWGGFWRKTRESEGGGDNNELLDKLRSLPYVTGSQPAVPETGVTEYDESRAYNGFNLYSSAHGPIAYLTEMDGDVIHTWRLDRDTVWKHMADLDQKKPRRYFRRVYLYNNGDLLVIYEYTGVVRMDKRAQVKWAHLGWNHHDMYVDDRGKIYVLGRDYDIDGRYPPSFGDAPPPRRYVHGRWVYDENITILGPRGALLDRFSIVDCIENSEYAYLLDRVKEFREEEPVDLIHANTVEVLDGRHEHRSPLYKKGNILTSFRNLSTIAIIDVEKRSVVWALDDAFLFQHDPRLLKNGRMMVFDNYNGGRTPEDSVFVSSVFEFDPFTREVFWSYSGDGNQNVFFSSLMGTSQPLPNGNVLITESDFGRAFEVTRDGEIVWQFNNPHLAGEDKELVAVLPEMIRLPPDFPLHKFKKRYLR